MSKPITKGCCKPARRDPVYYVVLREEGKGDIDFFSADTSVVDNIEGAIETAQDSSEEDSHYAVYEIGRRIGGCESQINFIKDESDQ